MTRKPAATSTATTLEAITTNSISPSEAFASLRGSLLSAEGEFPEKVYEAVRSLVWSSVSNRETRDLDDWADFVLKLRQLLRGRSSPLAERFTVLADFLEQSSRFAKFHPASELLAHKHVRGILEVLLAHGVKTTRATIAQATKLRDANLSRILANLASAGWINRQNEGREVVISLTEEGTAQARAALPKNVGTIGTTPFSDRASLEVVRAVWEKTNCAIAVSDSQKGVLSCDKNFASIFSVNSPEILVGTDVLSLRKNLAAMVDEPNEVVPDEVSLADGRTLRVVEFEAGDRSLWLSSDVTPYKRQLEEYRRRERFLLTQIDQAERSRPTKKLLFARGRTGEARVDASWPMIAALRSDLLTPINSINSIALLLLHKSKHIGTSNYDELVSGIIDQSTQLRTLLRDIVNVGELFGSSSLKGDRVKPTALLENVLRNLNYTKRHAHLSFSTEKAPTETIETNERALRGVMFQAVTGIVEMTTNGGSVGIETALEKDTIVMRVFTHSIDKELSAMATASKTLILCEHAVRHFGGKFDFTS